MVTKTKEKRIEKNKENMIIGIIPARGGSKGIPRKNIKMIAGKPLIAWTIEAAKESKLLDDFFVSTEDKEIAEVAKRYGAKVLDRPSHLAGDNIVMLDVLKHSAEATGAGTIVLLQPTSPIRDKGLIDSCIKRFQEIGADNLATGFICKLYEYGTMTKNRQHVNGWFYDDGSVYVYKSELLKNGKRIGGKSEKMIISREQNVEIDDEFDFWLCEQILKKRMAENEMRS